MDYPKFIVSKQKEESISIQSIMLSSCTLYRGDNRMMKHYLKDLSKCCIFMSTVLRTASRRDGVKSILVISLSCKNWHSNVGS